MPEIKYFLDRGLWAEVGFSSRYRSDITARITSARYMSPGKRLVAIGDEIRSGRDQSRYNNRQPVETAIVAIILRGDSQQPALMTTEIVCFPLRDAKSLQGEQALKKTLNILTSQDGFERAYWGWQKEENSKVFWVLVDWTSIQAHRNFQGKEYVFSLASSMYRSDQTIERCYIPFVQELDQTADVSRIQAFHAHLSPYPANKALSNNTSPVTEISTFHFPPIYSAEDRSQFEQQLLQLVAILKMHVANWTEFAGGWAAEDVPIAGTSEETTAFVACIGWQSVEAHFAFRESKTFKENEHLVSQAKGLKHIHMVHISATQVNRDGQF